MYSVHCTLHYNYVQSTRLKRPDHLQNIYLKAKVRQKNAISGKNKKKSFSVPQFDCSGKGGGGYILFFVKYIQEVLTLVCADASRGDVVPRRFSESSHKSDTRTSPDKKELKMMRCCIYQWEQQKLQRRTTGARKYFTE